MPLHSCSVKNHHIWLRLAYAPRPMPSLLVAKFARNSVLKSWGSCALTRLSVCRRHYRKTSQEIWCCFLALPKKGVGGLARISGQFSIKYISVPDICILFKDLKSRDARAEHFACGTGQRSKLAVHPMICEWRKYLSGRLGSKLDSFLVITILNFNELNSNLPYSAPRVL